MIAWRPLLVVLGGCGGALAAVHAVGSGPVPPILVGVALALLAAAALLGLDDPARDVLAAVPTSSARRQAHRLALLGPVLATGGIGLLAAARRLDLLAEGVGPSAASLLALAMVGLLVARLAGGWRPELTAPAGAAAPLAWVLAAAAVSGTRSTSVLVQGWAERPWPWAAVAAAGWWGVGRRARA